MPSQIDFAVAVALSIGLIAFLLSFLTGYSSRYASAITTSELRTSASNLFHSLFGKGIPENWEEQNYTPVKVGLAIDLYKIPIVVTERNGTERENVIINVSLLLDPKCEKRAWNSTIRVYEGSEEIASKLYNQSFCYESYLNSSDLVFNSSFLANQSKTFFVFFSGDRSIAEPSYSLPFSSPENFTVEVYPEEKLTAISNSKVNALQNLSYEEVVRTLGTEYKFRIEVSNITTLEIKAGYGPKPIGTLDRVVYEIPMLIQELSGKIEKVWARIIVWS